MLTEVLRGQIQAEKIDFVMEECSNCGTPFFMPRRLQRVLINNRNSFYCPNGHSMSYRGKADAERIKDQMEALRLEKEKELEVLQNRWLDALGEKNKLEKQLKRVHKGVCPCCNRSFVNLQQHMKTKHPEAVKK